MGRLLDAMRKREQDLLDHQARFQVNGAPPKIAEDPQKGYDYILRLNELMNLREKAGNHLTAAFGALTAEQRKEFFGQILSEARIADLAKVGFEQALSKARNQNDGGEAFRAFLSDEKNFGRPANVVLAGIKNLMNAQRRREVQEQLDKEEPNASPARQAEYFFGKLTQGQRDKLYQELVTDARKGEYLSWTLEDAVHSGQIGNLLLNTNGYRPGVSWLDAVEKMEQLMDPQLVEETARKIEEMPRPHLDPNKNITPYAQRISELQEGLSPQDPRSALLERIKGILVYPSLDYLRYLNNKDGALGDTMGLQYSMNAYAFRGTTRYLEQNLAAPLLEKLPHGMSQAEEEHYDPADVQPTRKIAIGTSGVDLEDQEVATLRQKSAGKAMAPEVKQAVHDFMDCINQMGEKSYWNAETVTALEGSPENPTKVSYKQEQGNKKYAFWPLVDAKNALADAVQAGDWEKIRQAEAEYQRRKAITDKMMEAANRTAKVPIFGGNVNSTRPADDGNGLNAVPTEYLEDFAGHSRANGLFLLYAASKNTGIPVDRLLDDPGGALREYGEKFRQEKLLSSQAGKPLGARLVHAFDNSRQLNTTVEWKTNMGLVSRGMNAVNGLIPDEADRVNNLGRNYCAEAAAGYEVGRESIPWQNLSGAKPGQKRMVMQLAMLLPEEEFKLQDLGMALSRNDWLKRLNPLNTIARLKAEHKLDYGAVTARSKELLSQVETAIQAGSGNPAVKIYEYRQAALRNYSQLLRTMPPDQRNTEGCKQMMAHAAQLQNDLVRDQLQDEMVQEDRTEISRELRTLGKKKSGWFLSEEDSPEYTRMMKSIKKLNLKLDLLEGKPLPANLSQKYLDSLQEANVAKLISKAKYDCYNYARLKTKEGKSGIVHAAGKERLRCSLKICERLGRLSTNLDIRPPAVELKDHAKLRVLQGRSSKSWETQNVPEYAARMIYALSLQYRGVPDAQQKSLIDKSLDTAVERIMNKPAFQQMVRNEGATGLAAKIVEGTEALTEAYMKAARQLEQPQAQNQQGPQPSREEKIDFWRRQEDPAAAPENPGLQL